MMVARDGVEPPTPVF